jgi:hypothetical protein
MAPLGALSQAWTAADAALPLGWRLSGPYRFDEFWVGLAMVRPSMAASPARGSTPSRRSAG